MTIRVATAPVSWGVMESLEPPADYPYARVLDEIATAGYAGTELGPYGFLPAEPTLLRRELDLRNLTLCSAFVAMHLGDETMHPAGLAHVERTARLIQAVGCRTLILADEMDPERCACAGRPEDAKRFSWSTQQWKAAESAIHQVLGLCRPLEVDVIFHNHVGTHVETPEELARLCALFAGEEIGLCLDTGHYAFGGGDPIEAVRQYGTRVRCVHLKDINPERLASARHHRYDFYEAVRHGVFAPLGHGGVNFAAMLAFLRQQGFDGWVVVERDVLVGGRGAESSLESARVSRQFLKNLDV